MATETERETPKAIDPYLMLLAGAVGGLVFLTLPVIWVSWWWQPLLAGLREGQRTGLWKPGLALGSVLAGLAIMFFCLQYTRRFERTDAFLRRALYGYNATLMGLLLLSLLVLVNIGVRLWFPVYLDTTEGGFHSVSDVTRNFVGTLERPTKVYMVLERNDRSFASMVSMLAQLRELNPKYFDFEVISPQLNTGRIRDLNKTFPTFTGEDGLIVASGEDEQKNYSFVPASELANVDLGAMGRESRRQFNGEVRLMQELMFLAESKKKPVIYFLQGHGEADLNDVQALGLATLQQKLTRANFDVRPLRFPADIDAKEATVPADADVVVVVGPRQPMANAIPALERYMEPTEPGKPKGKLVVLLGPTPADRAREGQMTETGLERFLNEKFGVDITGEQILTFALPTAGGFVIDQNPARVVLTAAQEAVEARHPLAQTFKDQLLEWYECRSVRVNPQRPANRPQVIMDSVGVLWTESDMRKPFGETYQLLRSDRSEQQRRLRKEPLPLMVAVSESAGGGGHGFASPGEGQKPRAVVIGCSQLAVNLRQRGGGQGDANFDLIRGSIDWCRERYSNIGIQPKTHQSFSLPAKVTEAKLFWLPLCLMLLTFMGLGLIVWNTRRR